MAAIKMSFVDMKVSSSSILFLIPLQLNCRIFKFKVLAFDFALGAGRGGGEGGGAARGVGEGGGGAAGAGDLQVRHVKVGL